MKPGLRGSSVTTTEQYMAEPQGSSETAASLVGTQLSSSRTKITLKPSVVGPSQAQAETTMGLRTGLKRVSGGTEYWKGGFRGKTAQSSGR